MKQTQTIVLEGWLSPSDVGKYHHLPFEVPPDTERLDVRYTYTAAVGSDPHLTDGNTLDIGIFDARGIDFPGGGFRGWTGSARREFYITSHEATPGYLPGPVSAGVWHICLGFYKSAPAGCGYRIEIQLSPSLSPQSSEQVSPLLGTENQTRCLTKPDGWYRGELHCHSCHSDGDSAPADLIREAQKLGLDFLAITDHNNTSQLAALAGAELHNLVLIPGFEVTTYKGHWNVWGINEWIDFRDPTPEKMEQWITVANQRGGLTSCNHPRPYGPPWEFADAAGYHCVEVWNGPWELGNSIALAFGEERLQKGERLVMVGGSDTHFLRQPHIAHLGTPTTWIYCPGQPTATGLLAGLRAGHAFISDSPNGPQIYLSSGRAMMGDTVSRGSASEIKIEVRVVDGTGLRWELHSTSGCLHRQLVEYADQWFEYLIEDLPTPYVRAQLVQSDDPATVRALTNPLYFSAG